MATPRFGTRLFAVLAALRRPKVAAMAGLGFSSGLPFLLTSNTLGFWLREGHVSLTAIGFASWVSLAYGFKFLWAPILDRVDAPGLGRFGRRRGWMILSQAVVAIGLLAMGGIGPTGGLPLLAAAAVLVAFASASQDINVDAWRIEIASDPEELGLLTSAYQLGYRVALLIADAGILILADFSGWSLAYGAMAVLMGIGLLASFSATEPRRAVRPEAETSLMTPRGLIDAVVGPFIAFFRQHGVFAILLLTTITLYHLPDYLRGPITNPFYKDIGLSKTLVGEVRGSIGLASIILGIFLGGVSALRWGHGPTLIIGAVIQPLAIALFALLAWQGADLLRFQVIMVLDDFAIGYSGVALVAYMSSLTTLGYTATQYALLSSALSWTGKSVKGFSGLAIDLLHNGRSLNDAYALFYLGAAALGIPAVILCLVLAARLRRERLRVA